MGNRRNALFHIANVRWQVWEQGAGLRNSSQAETQHSSLSFSGWEGIINPVSLHREAMPERILCVGHQCGFISARHVPRARCCASQP